jgi:hypothetical protein
LSSFDLSRGDLFDIGKLTFFVCAVLVHFSSEFNILSCSNKDITGSTSREANKSVGPACANERWLIICPDVGHLLATADVERQINSLHRGRDALYLKADPRVLCFLLIEAARRPEEDFVGWAHAYETWEMVMELRASPLLRRRG